MRILLDYLEGGEPLEAFLDNYPSVTREQAVGFLEEAGRAALAQIACDASFNTTSCALKHPYRVFDELLIYAGDHKIVVNGLTDDHAVERIAVMHRKCQQVGERCLFEWEAGDLMFLPAIPQIFIGRGGQRQLS